MSLAKFISFEGCDGAGKTVQSQMLHNYILSLGIKSILTREPGGTEISELIRQILLNKKVLGKTELLLFVASRYEHMEKVIKPALKNDTWVICDRFIDSTICYQGVISGISEKFIFKLHNLLFGKFYLPDKTFFLKLKPVLALKRIQGHKQFNRYDSMEMNLHNDIYKKFCALAKKYHTRIVSIDVKNNDAKLVHKTIVNHILNLKWITSPS